MATNRTTLTKEVSKSGATKHTTQENKKKSLLKQHLFPLTKLIKCYDCGCTFSPSKRSRSRTLEKDGTKDGKIDYLWRCMSRINNQKFCKCSVNLSNEKVEKIIWELIKKEHGGLVNLCTSDRDNKINQIQHKIDSYKKEVNFQKKQKAKYKTNSQKAYSVYKVDAKLNPIGAKKRLANVLQNIQVEIEYSNASISSLEKAIASSLNMIQYYKGCDYYKEYIAAVEKNDTLKRTVFIRLIKYIIPYPIRYRVAVLEVHTTLNKIYYVLLNANQRNHKVAYFFDFTQAIWQKNELSLDSYEKGAAFVIPNTSTFMNTGEISNLANFEQMELLCKLNNQTINYNPENVE